MRPNDMTAKAELMGRREVDPSLSVQVRLGDELTATALISNGGGLCTLKFPVRVGATLLLDVKVNVSWEAVNNCVKSGAAFDKIPGLRTIRQEVDSVSTPAPSEVETLEAYKATLPKGDWSEILA